MAQIVGSQPEKGSGADALPSDFEIKTDLVGPPQGIAANTDRHWTRHLIQGAASRNPLSINT